MGLPALFTRIESIVVFGAATTAYFMAGYNGWLYLLLFFSFDISLVGYVGSSRLGAITYNSIHNFSLPVALFVVGMMAHNSAAMAYALLWVAHIGFDRTIGFGLMLANRFGDTSVAVFPRISKGRR